MAPIAFRTRPLSRNRILLLLLTIATLGHGLDKPAFARSLEAESDWFRAIGVWKEVRFEAQDETVRRDATQAILVDLWKAGQYEAGLRELALWNRETPGSFAWLGLFQYKLSRFSAAEYALTRAGDPRYLGLLLARTGRLEDAAQLWANLDLPDPRLMGEGKKSPPLAAAASLVLPGSGQMYSGHWFDGFQALTMVSFFGVSAYGTYLYDREFSSNYGLTITSAAIGAFFYVANSYGAWKTAEFYNQSRDLSVYRAWEGAVFRGPLPEL